MAHRISKLMARYLAAVIGTVIGFIAVASVYVVSDWLEIELLPEGCMAALAVPLIYGAPIGNALAIAFVDRVIFKSKPVCIPAIILAMILAFPGMILGVLFMDRFGSQAIFSIPFFSAVLSAPAYHLIVRWRRPAWHQSL